MGKETLSQNQIWLKEVTRSSHQIAMSFGLDDVSFNAAYWYGDVDLLELEGRYGQALMNKIYFHTLAFEAMKLVNLAPAAVDLGDFACFYTPEFERLWRYIVTKVWAQWRYENNLPHYASPHFTSQPLAVKIAPVRVQHGAVGVLSFCGGGKDSYVAMKLLERAHIPYASFAYSHSAYGPSEQQHDLIENLLSYSCPVKRHQLRAYDTLSDAPLRRHYPKYATEGGLIVCETPASIFAALPVVLQHGYRYLVLANERSANAGNLIWDSTNEEVNHQWGKSLEAEGLLNDYLQSEFIVNSTYFSLLQPIHDVVIFNLLRRDGAGVTAAHSCNIRKPWCNRCPKCAYVWLNYMAYLDTKLVDSIFKANLFDLEENQRWFREMLGLADHTPFECIGQIEETRLAFELCRRKGLTGKAMEMYKREFPALDINPILERFLTVGAKQANFPDQLSPAILPQMEAAASEARRYINSICKPFYPAQPERDAGIDID